MVCTGLPENPAQMNVTRLMTWAGRTTPMEAARSKLAAAQGIVGTISRVAMTASWRAGARGLTLTLGRHRVYIERRRLLLERAQNCDLV